MRNESYVRAVHNMERLVNLVQDSGMVADLDISTLKFNLFLLKAMPMYSGLEIRKKDDSAG